MTLLDRLTRPPHRGRPHTQERIARTYRRKDDGLDYYGGMLIGARALGRRATEPAIHSKVAQLLAAMEPDDYMRYVQGYVESGARIGGAEWRFADIVTALCAATERLEPTSYLEVGVRRGRSMAIVAGLAPKAHIVGVDMWIGDYAKMENPGPDHVRHQMAAIGHEGKLELITGNSHTVVPRLFRQRPELTFDLVAVDGDHTHGGAARDLRAVLPRLRIGGALVFDDVRHSAHPYLNDVWHRSVAADRRYTTWQYDDAGYGVAIAVRQW